MKPEGAQSVCFEMKYISTSFQETAQPEVQAAVEEVQAAVAELRSAAW
jgi:hypothetical protein